MAAIGINVSDKDQTYDYTGLRSARKMFPALQEAREEAKRKWDFFTSHVDFWIEKKYEALEKGDLFTFEKMRDNIVFFEDQALMADMKVQMICKQRDCSHEFDEEDGCCKFCGIDYWVVHDPSVAHIDADIE